MLKTLFKMIFWRFKGAIIYCPFCHSPETEYYDVTEKVTGQEADVSWSINCNTCGATGMVNEAWVRGAKLKNTTT